MRWLICFLCATLTAVDGQGVAESGTTHAAVAHALQALKRGDTEPLQTLSDLAFTQPPALRDPLRAGITVPWPWLIEETLPTTLTAAAAEVIRTNVVTRLLANRSHLDSDVSVADLLDLLRRRGMATPGLRSSTSPMVPGWPTPFDGEPEDVAHAGWIRARRHLMAVLPCGMVAWQTSLEPSALVWSGHGGALIGDSLGLRWLWPTGMSATLPPLPPDVLPLGVDHGAAFFAQGTRGWRLQPAGNPDSVSSNFAIGRPEFVQLPEEPLGAPLAGDNACLWLTMTHLVHWNGSEAHPYRHGLPVGRGWKLARDRTGNALIVAPDGSSWTIPPHQPNLQTDELLGRFNDLTQLADVPRDLRFRDALRRNDWANATLLARDANERATVAHYAGQPPPSDINLRQLIPRDVNELPLPPSAWRGGISTSVRHAAPVSMSATRMSVRPLDDTPESCPDMPIIEHLVGGLAIGRRQWIASDDRSRALATCTDGGNTRWFTRWLPEVGAVAPLRSLWLADDHLFIGEGESRLLCLNATTGAIELDARPRQVPILPGRTWLRSRPSGVAGAMVLYPPGLDDRLGWIASDGSERIERLAGPARWLLALPDGERWLCRIDGTMWSGLDTADAMQVTWLPIHVPEGLRTTTDMPRVVAGGIAAGNQRWNWK